MNIRIYLSIIILLVSINAAAAQTTAFNYQGKLTDGANLANGNYDFQFRLFDALSGGTQQGATVQLLSVAVSNGSFTVQLDFGNQFTGAARFLDIGVKTASDRTFTVLSPRQQMTSNPYAIKSLNAANATAADGLSIACVNCVTSSQIQSVNGSAVTGSIPVASVPAGSASYVQNTTSQQASSNFNISGDGTLGGVLSANSAAITNTASANIFDATTQFNISGSRAFTLSSFSRNVFAGVNAGAAGGIGGSNSFFGHGAGEMTTSGASNSFFGKQAGNANTASNNSFFGADAGLGNTSGTRNSFFGLSTGRNNTTGSDNAFFGYRAGLNSTASFNSFFGSGAGDSTTTGADNAFFGYNAGTGNLIGGKNAFFGSGAGQLNTGGDNSFFGYHAGMSNTVGMRNTFLGSEAGLSSNGYDNSFFGYHAGYNNTGNDNTILGNYAGVANTTGNNNVFIGSRTGQTNSTGTNNTVIGTGANVFGGNLDHATAIGADAVVATSNTIQIGRPSGDIVKIGNLFVNGVLEGGSGTYLGYTEINGSLRIPGEISSESSQNLCITDFGLHVVVCGSSLRFKTNVETFTGGLDILRRLRPITFNWQTNGIRDIGFAAEEVEKVEPLLATYNGKGVIQGVKYGQITTVLVNAVKEQQRQIEEQKQQLRVREQQAAQQQQQLHKQQQEIAVLKQWVCRTHPKAALCQPANHTKR